MASLSDSDQGEFDKAFRASQNGPNEWLPKRLEDLGMDTRFLRGQRLQDIDAIVTPVLNSRYALGLTVKCHGVYYHVDGENAKLWFVIQTLAPWETPGVQWWKYAPFLVRSETYTVDLIAKTEDEEAVQLFSLAMEIHQAKSDDKNNNQLLRSIMATFSVTLPKQAAEKYHKYYFDRTVDLFLTVGITPKPKLPPLVPPHQ
jgi:hypothetical protein